MAPYTRLPPPLFFDVVRNWFLREHKIQGYDRKMRHVRASCTQCPHANVCLWRSEIDQYVPHRGNEKEAENIRLTENLSEGD
ncbi:MAG: hypothetical protein OSA89_16795 [Mariniblastus sp.]|nr:hypothetical protein [Mariniblastus sp.]